MEQRRTLRTRGEVIEEFARPLNREVVETYVRPLPHAPSSAPVPAPRHRQPPVPPMPRAGQMPYPPPGQYFPPPPGQYPYPATGAPYQQPLPPGMAYPPPAAVPAQRHRRHQVRPKVWRGIALLLAAAGAFALLAGGAQWLFDRLTSGWAFDPEYFYYERSQEKNENAPITIPTAATDPSVRLSLSDGGGDTLSPQAVYEKVSPAVVTVMVTMDGDKMAIGTGVLFRQDGYLMTNHHVVAGGASCTIFLADGTPYRAKFIASTPDYDLAVLKIDGRRFPTAEFCDSDTLVVGEPVYAIGTPLNLDMGGTFTDGIVSSLDREMALTEGGASLPLIQTNAALNNGNSGGPLINDRGQVVGINFMKLSARANTVEGLGFAIPSLQVERVVNDLLATGKVQPEPLLGLSVSQQPELLDEESGLWGIRVREVPLGGVANKGGVHAGDYILQADGKDILSSSALLKARWKHRLGEEMLLTIWRKGEILTLTLRLTDALEEETDASVQEQMEDGPEGRSPAP